MSAKNPEPLSNCSMLELFRVEVENQSILLTEGLLALEREPGALQHLEVLMRAAHSMKGAARLVNHHPAVRVAHAMEDCFVAAQKGTLALPKPRIDVLLQGVDLLNRLAQTPEAEIERGAPEHQGEIGAFLGALAAATEADGGSISAPTAPLLVGPGGSVPAAADTDAVVPGPPPLHSEAGKPVDTANRVLRVSAETLDRLLGLAGESLLASRRHDTFATELLRLKRVQQEVTQSLNGLRELLADAGRDERVEARLIELQRKTIDCRLTLGQHMEEIGQFGRQFANLSNRLHQEVLDCRMRPFAEGIHGFPRMVRDIAHALGKRVKLAVLGEATPVDREILERIETALGHLLRNALDHGIETPAERQEADKPEEATVQLEACHSAGMLLISVADDGRGIATEVLRQAVVQKQLAAADVAGRMSDAELFEFLFLPGFTMKGTVTEISGRGVGLDEVQSIVKKLGGSLRVTSRPGQGTQFQLQLPLTLSVIRALLVEIAGEPYAVLLSRVTRVMSLPREQIASVEGRQHFAHDDQQIGLVTAHQILDLGEYQPSGDTLPVLILGDKTTRYGLVVDRFLGERELVVRALDPRLGKIQNISAAALLPDQSPVLILDMDDLIRSIENLVSGGRLAYVGQNGGADAARKRQRVLVVEDSLTVRELERKLLDANGYDVEVAVDGMDGWNAVRTGAYDLVVTDVDMPRMDGIELLTLIRKDSRLKSLPVMIVSYKDREEDRRRGLEAGADYYMTKGSFHDETLLHAVADLIGEPGTPQREGSG